MHKNKHNFCIRRKCNLSGEIRLADLPNSPSKPGGTLVDLTEFDGPLLFLDARFRATVNDVFTRRPGLLLEASLANDAPAVILLGLLANVTAADCPDQAATQVSLDPDEIANIIQNEYLTAMDLGWDQQKVVQTLGSMCRRIGLGAEIADFI